MKRLVCAFVLLTGMTVLQACGGSSPMEATLPQQPAAVTDNPAEMQAGLPAYEDLLESDVRSASIVGPGWYNLDLLNRSFGNFESGVTEDAPALDIAGAGGNGFSVFGVHGFDGDAFPTGIRTDVSNVNGEYFLAHTNYVTGRWETAGPFTDSTTYEYPEVSQYSDPDNFISSYTNHFVAIIVPDGNSLQLDMLQLGVDGGDVGPEAIPASSLKNNGNENLLTISWSHSPSIADPDFAGYSVERSNFPAGQYTKLTGENILDNFYNDPSAELNRTYLYRLTSWDTSGHQTQSPAFPGQRKAGMTASPVCVVDMPRGPLNGPVNVRFDMSDSYDNDNDAFTEYLIDFGQGLGEVAQPDPVFDVTLQPGCYSLRMKVTTGAQSDTKYRMLKVYPRWQEEGHLIDAGIPVSYRAFAPRAFYDPDSGKVVFLYSDASVPSIVSLTIDADGNMDRFDLQHIFEDAQMLCTEPVMLDGIWTFMAGTENNFWLCTWHDNEIERLFIDGSFGNDSSFGSLVSDGDGAAWVIFHNENGGHDLMLLDLNTFVPVVLDAGLAAENFIDAVWNPLSEAIEIVYSGNGAVQWMRWSPVVGPVAGFAINPADSQFVDVEIDPVSNRPIALMHDGISVLYSELNADELTWTVASKVDAVDPDWPQTQLNFRNGTTYCYIGDNPGDSSLYRKNGANWDVVNDADFADGGGYSAMTYNPSVPGFYVLDVALDFATRITLMREDGTESEIMNQEGWARMGLELCAASSATELHVIHQPLFVYEHLTSADGVVWTPTDPAGNGAGGKIVGADNGKIYNTIISLGDVYLREWTNPGWIDKETQPISNNSLPMLYGQGHALVFGNFNGDAVPDIFHYKRDLDPAFNFQPAATQIWDGAFAGASTNEAKLLVRYGGVNFNDGQVGIMDTSGAINYLFEPSLPFFDDPWTRSRHLEGAFYRDELQSSREVFYVAYGPGSGLARIHRNAFNEWVTQDIDPKNPYVDTTGYRRTVSATTAWGDTAVGIGASLLGDVFFFEWDNFGNFEDLPLPVALLNETASHHELVVGPDGRWHIIYRDYANDDLRIISTVN